MAHQILNQIGRHPKKINLKKLFSIQKCIKLNHEYFELFITSK